MNLVTDQSCGGHAAQGPEEEGGMLHQVDEEVGGAVEHGEQVGQLGDVLDPVRPQQLALHTVAQDFRFFPRYYSMYYIYNGTYRTVFSTFIALLLSVFIRKLLFF